MLELCLAQDMATWQKSNHYCLINVWILDFKTRFHFLFFVSLLILFVCTCVCTCICVYGSTHVAMCVSLCVCTDMCMNVDQEKMCFPPGDATEVIRLHHKWLYKLSHLPGPTVTTGNRRDLKYHNESKTYNQARWFLQIHKGYKHELKYEVSDYRGGSVVKNGDRFWRGWV